MLAVAGPTALAQQSLPDAFVGMFRGKLSDKSGSADGEFTVVIRRSDAGFAVSWPPRVTANLQPAGRPNIFKTSGKLSLLDGNSVYWARIDGETLIVYAAQMGERGEYRIDSYLYTVSGDGLDLVVRQLAAGAEPRILNGRLSRYGG